MNGSNTDSMVFKYLCSQFGNPRGLLGRLAGNLMARRPSNRERNFWTLDLLEINAEDHILEIGFGPGLAIERAAGLATRGRIVGIDRSVTMLEMASRRNGKAIDQGRVELLRGSLEEFDPEGNPAFHKIYSVNTWMFWSDRDACMSRLSGLLLKGGKIAITHQPRSTGATREDAMRTAEEIAACMRSSGLMKTTTHVRELEPVAAVCVVGSA